VPADRPAVLIVDDVEANLVAIEAQLGQLDCDIVRASSGNEALRLLLKREFAVILLDVQMPGMDGFEVAHLARQEVLTREVPIIFVTAMRDTEDNVLRGYETGAVDLLFKPVNPYVLLSKVRVFLDLHRSRQKLAREIEAHKQTLAQLDAFNYSVSHDLRAPLRPLSGFAQILLEDYSGVLDDTAKNYLHRMRAAAERMGGIIDALLHLSRIGRATIKRAAVDLSALATVILGELKESDPTRDVRLVVEPELTVEGDARLLRILLENLLRNAWKFTKKKPTATIEVGARRSDGETAYFVRDDGAGFALTYAHRLFKPFQRLHSDTDYEGTGIGLATVQRIVDSHGGRVWAESEPGRGATFLFTLDLTSSS
jgi:two-component system sensor histidine kinase/response regulator